LPIGNKRGRKLLSNVAAVSSASDHHHSITLRGARRAASFWPGVSSLRTAFLYPNGWSELACGVCELCGLAQRMLKREPMFGDRGG
jgi:hypothetical protein